ncbi:hypothetical protein Ocin01_15749 [Orchesella cincta]|uniref:Secreted protein n=1 Tax=Orchesella cincta TaxID=48709 RepID=A0A1D2MD98_ORCCI|nr:hypothetical protein Ocin01_15749 [Orchesella cincta]
MQNCSSAAVLVAILLLIAPYSSSKMKLFVPLFATVIFLQMYEVVESATLKSKYVAPRRTEQLQDNWKLRFVQHSNVSPAPQMKLMPQP